MSRATSGICCLIGVDKPQGMTSHDVVSHVRRALHERRVGHAGTLDPAAAGVLVVGVGQATRLLGQLTLDEKSYEATIAFGMETSTDDAEGEVLRRCEVAQELLDVEYASSVVAGLVGASVQVPPVYSAISVEGRRAYDRARAGEAVELEARPIEVYEAELLELVVGNAHNGSELGGAPLAWRVRLHVSKGTYIRAIARDLGRNLGTAAHLRGLRRTSSGMVNLATCLPLAALETDGVAAIKGSELDPVRALNLPVRLLDLQELGDVGAGRRLSAGLVLDLAGDASEGLRPPRRAERVSLVLGNKFYGIWEERGGQLCAQTNFPTGITGVRA